MASKLGDPTIPATATADAAAINDQLYQLYLFARSFGFDLSFLDTFGLEDAAVANPAAYGFTNVTDPCFNGVTVCANPDQYLFWDDLHPTAAGHQLLADAALARLDVLRQRAEAVDAGPVHRAMSNLKTALRQRLSDDVDKQLLFAVADAIDDAARKIERL